MIAGGVGTYLVQSAMMFLDFANHIKIAMEKHTDLFTFTHGLVQVDSSVSLLSISSNLSHDC
jgi:hypothetical protein